MTRWLMILAALGLTLAGCTSKESLATDELKKDGLSAIKLTPEEGSDSKFAFTATRQTAECTGTILVMAPPGSSNATFDKKIVCSDDPEVLAKKNKKPKEDTPQQKLQKACEGGDKDKCAELARLLVEGPPGTRDLKKARELNKTLCDGGEMVGCEQLGTLLIRGLGGDQDEAGATELFKKACDAGHMAGCSSLGRVYYVSRKEEEAWPLFKKACDGGDLEGCNNLARLMKIGQGGDQDEKGARELFDNTCQLGHMGACTNLALMLKHGEGGPKNAARAKELLTAACEADKGGVACAQLKKM